MKTSENFSGSLCGILSAVTYGMNPLFGLPLYQRGMTTSSVLFYRFLFTIIILGCFMLIRRNSFALPRHQILPMGVSGVLLALSCLFLFLSFHHIEAGIAATILFIYPIMVCAIMFFFFHVRQSLSTLVGMIISHIGNLAAFHGECGRAIQPRRTDIHSFFRAVLRSLYGNVESHVASVAFRFSSDVLCPRLRSAGIFHFAEMRPETAETSRSLQFWLRTGTGVMPFTAFISLHGDCHSPYRTHQDGNSRSVGAGYRIVYRNYALW